MGTLPTASNAFYFLEDFTERGAFGSPEEVVSYVVDALEAWKKKD